MSKLFTDITRGVRLALIVLTVIALADVLAALSFVWCSKSLIDMATGKCDGDILFFSILLVLLILLQIIFRSWGIWLRNITEIRLTCKVQSVVYNHLMYVRWNTFQFIHSGDMMARIIRDTEELSKSLVVSLPLFVSSIFQLLGALWILFTLSSSLAIFLGLGMPLLILFSKIYYMKIRIYVHGVKEAEKNVVVFVEESLMNQLVVRSFVWQSNCLLHLRSLHSHLQGRVEKKNNVSLYTNIVMQLAFGAGYVGTFLWSVYGLSRENLSFGTVAAYLQLASRIQRPLFDLMGLFSVFISAKACCERLSQLLEYKRENIAEQVFLTARLHLFVNDVKFAYASNGSYIFDGFSLSAKSGEMIAIMGQSGAGKTTLFRLLLGLERPESGEVLLECLNQKVKVTEESRSNFAYVPQGSSLFSGTIRQNLLIGNENASEDDLIYALETASALFVLNFSLKLDTVVGEGGIGLSEGQAQRIALARAILCPGKILLLDESTSALDLDTEQKILHRLKERINDRIILFITHHHSVADCCDKIIYI